MDRPPELADLRFPMSHFKRNQRKYVKKAYRVRNWCEYEAGLPSARVLADPLSFLTLLPSAPHPPPRA
jgi:hypothetical protein